MSKGGSWRICTTSKVPRSTRRSLAECEMIALLVAHVDRMAGGEQRPAVKRQRLGLVIEELVSAPLRLEHDGEGRIAGDIDALDRVHLHGDTERHGLLFRLEGIGDVARPAVGGYRDDVKTADAECRLGIARHPDARRSGDAARLIKRDRLDARDRPIAAPFTSMKAVTSPRRMMRSTSPGPDSEAARQQPIALEAQAASPALRPSGRARSCVALCSLRTRRRS